MSHTSLSGRRQRVAASPRSRRLMRCWGSIRKMFLAAGQEAESSKPTFTAHKLPPAARSRRRSPLRWPIDREPAAHWCRAAPRRCARAIAHFTTLSAAVPQFQLRAEVDVTALTVLREQLLQRIEADSRVRLSYTDLLLAAQALALRNRARRAPCGKTAGWCRSSRSIWDWSLACRADC